MDQQIVKKRRYHIVSVFFFIQFSAHFMTVISMKSNISHQRLAGCRLGLQLQKNLRRVYP